ncbi:MAG: GNAT family protein [Chloroflexi bacterium]|nr:GNAT family protein [Chloroflexota bacterium]MDA1296784.1 GNAT family protein [Chloroflexota bacterium]
MSRPAPEYVGKLVTVRQVKESDVTDFMAKGGQPETILAYGGDPSTARPPTQEAFEQWVRWVNRFPDSLKWVIERAGHGIGQVRLDDIDEAEGHARLAIGIWHPDDWGHGYGTDATRLALRHAFEGLRLHRIDLVVLESNARAIRSYEKSGFKHKGVLRERALVLGERQNDLIMSILRHEYVG